MTPVKLCWWRASPRAWTSPNASTGDPSTSQVWLALLTGAHGSLDIVSFYLTLTNNDIHTWESSVQELIDPSI